MLLGTMWALWHAPFFLYPDWSGCPVWIYLLILTGLSVLMTLVANLARFGVIAPIIMHVVNNTLGKYFKGLFADAGPGSGGFLNDLVRLTPFRASWIGSNTTFYMLIAIGSWIATALVLVFRKTCPIFFHEFRLQKLASSGFRGDEVSDAPSPVIGPLPARTPSGQSTQLVQSDHQTLRDEFRDHTRLWEGLRRFHDPLAGRFWKGEGNGHRQQRDDRGKRRWQ